MTQVRVAATCAASSVRALQLVALFIRVCIITWHHRNTTRQLVSAGGECGVAHEKRFKMPLPAPGAFFYSFDFGPIHFLQYSTEVPFDEGSQQYR